MHSAHTVDNALQTRPQNQWQFIYETKEDDEQV